MSLTKYVASALGKASFREAWAAGGWKVLIDGNLACVQAARRCACAC